MCLIVPEPYVVRKRICEIVAQADEGASIEEIASRLRVPRATVLIYLCLAEFACSASQRTTATRLLKEAAK